MVKTVTPFSSRAKEGATDSPLGDFVEVKQAITSTASAGFYDENGKLTGNQSNDRQFHSFSRDEAVPNTAEILTPTKGDNPHWPLDMTGFEDVIIAIKPSRGGNYAISAVMGPDTETFAGLTPVNPAAILKFSNNNRVSDTSLEKVLEDAAESCTADVWNIFIIQQRCANQKLLQFKIVNNSGGESNIECAFMRMV